MLQKGFFLTESHNPNLPPETWELVAEFTTPGTYTQSLDWGKYRFEASAGGGGGAAAKATGVSFNTAGASGGTGAYGSFAFAVDFGNTDNISLVVGAGGSGGVRTNGTAPSTGGGKTTLTSSILGIIVTLNGGGAGYAHATSNGDTAYVGSGGTYTTILETHNLNNGKSGVSASTSGGSHSAGRTTNPSPYNTTGYGGSWSYGDTMSGENGGAGFIRIYKSNLKPEPV